MNTMITILSAVLFGATIVGYGAAPGLADVKSSPENSAKAPQGFPILDEADICRAPRAPDTSLQSAAATDPTRLAAERWMLMMQEMEGITAAQSPWVRAKLAQGIRPAHAPGHLPAAVERTQGAADALHPSFRGLLESIATDGSDLEVRAAAHLPLEGAAGIAGVSGDFAGLVVSVQPGGSAPPPADADRHYRVAAIDMDIVYNRFGGHDPAGKVFVLEQHREQVQRGSGYFNGGHDPLFYGHGYQGDLVLTDPETGQPEADGGPVIPVEPLVLRANRGETVVIDFTNRLGSAEPANLMITGAAYDTSAIDPAASTPLADPSSSDAYQLRYVLTIGAAEATEGTYYFRSRPVLFDNVSEGLSRTREQIRHGLFGALLVEPPDAVYLDPNAYAVEAGSVDGRGGYELDPDSYREVEGGWSAIIASPTGAFPAFREHVIFFHDDLAGILAGLIDSNPRAIGYRTEPFADIFEPSRPNTRPRIAEAQPFAVNDRSMAYSAYTYGDSSTPHPRFYVGDPMRYRVVHAGTGEEFHVFHHHAHRWRAQPGIAEAGGQGSNLTEPSKWGRPAFPGQPDVTTSSSTRIDSQTLGPAETFDVLMEGGAGGTQRSVGDMLLHCHIIQHVTQGMWTYARVYNTLQQASAEVPGLAPLPDRLGPDLQPPIAVDSLTLVQMVEDGVGPVPVSGPLAGVPIADVEDQLYPYLDAQLPTPGVPDLDKAANETDSDTDLAAINYADRWDWEAADFAEGRLYLGEPWDLDGPSLIKFGVGFPTVGEGVGVRRVETGPGGAALERRKLLFNPADGRLAYPQLLPQAGQRPPFASKKELVCPGAGQPCTVVADTVGQGTAYLGPRFGAADPGRDAQGEALGVPTGSGLVPEEAEGDPSNVKHYDIVALQLPLDYATHSGAPVTASFGTAAADDDGEEPEGGRRIEFHAVDFAWQAVIDDSPVDPSTADIVVAPGDTIVWLVGAGEHGVTFPEWADAEAFLEFDSEQGLPIGPEPIGGPNAQGTAGNAEAGTVLAQAVVKERGDLDTLDFICTVHGFGMVGKLCFGQCAPTSVDETAQLFVLRDDVPDILAGRKRAEPLVIRANAGDVVDVTLTSALVDQDENRNYSKVGIHTHLVQYDAQSSDGAVGGLNYETSVRPALRWNPVSNALEPIASAADHEERVHYRWWADTELGMVYFHDHSLLKDSLKHGLFGASVIEPDDATYHDPDTGDPLYVAGADDKITASSAHGGTTRADIRVDPDAQDPFGFREFVPIFNDGRFDSINLRQDGLTARIGDPPDPLSSLSVDWRSGGAFLSGGIETAFSSRLHGDPPTNTWRAISGDDIRVRTEGGGLNQIHTLNLHNNRFRFEANNPMSTHRDFVLVGVSEAFSFELDNPGLAAADYLYRSGGHDDVVRNGKWGLLRVYAGAETGSRAAGEVRLRLDRPAAVTVPAGQLFQSVRGTEYAADLEVALSQEQVAAQILRDTTPPTHFVDVRLTAVHATDEGNLPAGVAFATDITALTIATDDGDPANVVEMASKAPFEGGVTPLQGLPGAGAAGGGRAGGADASGREVEIVGASGPNRWIVTIDGEEQAGFDMTLEPGDRITWRSGQGFHGVTFQDWSAAQELLEIDASQGEPLTPRDASFGPEPMGTEGFGDNRVLVVATVIAQATLSAGYTCTIHGPDQMTGTLSVDVPASAGREIVVEGLSSNVWQISVDGAVQPGTTVAVAPGDTVEWRVASGFHGVTFPAWSEAEPVLAFEAGAGLPIVDQAAFGADARGTAGAGPGTLLARATVQEPGTLDALAFICTIHGPPMSGTLELPGAAPDERRAWVEPAPEPGPLPDAVRFHVAAVAVGVPERGPPGDGSAGDEVVVDANSDPTGLFWQSGDLQSADLTIAAQPGDILVFRQADTVMPHGLIFNDPAQIIKLGETEADKPDAILRELGEGASGLDTVIGAIAGGQPQEFARFEVLREITTAIDFECFVHGAAMRGSIKGAAPSGREIVVEGLSSNVWQISVDGAVQPGTTVAVAPGDTVEWRVASGFHGVTFPAWSEAEPVLAFEAGVGLPIVAQPAFGADARGTSGAGPGTLLARATVQEPGTLDALAFICTIHGPPMSGTLEFGDQPAGREIEIVGASGPNRWIVTIDGVEQAGFDVMLEPGDRITWRSGQGFHGVTFQDWSAAQALFEIDVSQGEPLTLRDASFGPEPMGTEGFGDDRVLAVATVRAQAMVSTGYTCTIHGPNQMTGTLSVPGAVEITPALAYVRLVSDPEIELAEAITALTRAHQPADAEIEQLTAMLAQRFIERPEPLVLRVAAGEQGADGSYEPVDVVVRLTNLLPRPASPLSSLWAPATSIHASLLRYDQEAADGTATGHNRHSLVVRGDSRDYHWVVDRPLGLVRLADTANPAHQLAGLFGALIVEPPGTEVLPAVAGEPGAPGWQALIRSTDGSDAFREFVLFLHDGWDAGGWAINYFSAAGHAADPPTPRLRAHATDPIVIRPVHAAGLGALTNFSFFVEVGRTPFDLDDPRSNQIAAIAMAPGAAFNLRLSPVAEAAPGVRPERFLYGSAVGDHLEGGVWGILELLPPGDPAILALDETEALFASAALGQAPNSPAGQHHVVTASGSGWLYQGRRSRAGEQGALRIPVARGDTVEFRQSDGQHGVFFYVTPRDHSELGRTVDVTADFEVVAGKAGLERLSNRLFDRTARTTGIQRDKGSIVTIRITEDLERPIYFGDPNLSTGARRLMFGALVPAPPPATTAGARPPMPLAAALEGRRASAKAAAGAIAAAPASLDLGALSNTPGKTEVIRGGELIQLDADRPGASGSPVTAQWFAALPDLDPRRRHWFQATSADLDGDGDLDVVAAIAAPDGRDWQWWLLQSNVADGEALAQSDLRFNGAWPLSPIRFPAGQGPDAFAIAADLHNAGLIDVVTYDGAGGSLQVYRPAGARAPREKSLQFEPTGRQVDLGRLGDRRPDLVLAEDFDFDGWNDLLIASGETSLVFFNDNTGGFPSESAVALGEAFGPVARATFGDLGGDARFGILLESTAGDNMLYMSTDRRGFERTHP